MMSRSSHTRPSTPRSIVAVRSVVGLIAAVTLLAVAVPFPSLAGAPAERFAADRQAILAMAGVFDVSFHFEETISLAAGYEPKEAYDTSAQEVVRVIEDSGERIVLQHLLLVTDGDGETWVIKHWRQDWLYEHPTLFEYQGGKTWAPRQVDASRVEGTWVQQVYQVDDSPRYQGIGRWNHDGGVSCWESAPTWRPLPRRDYTKRSDYHVIVAENRHCITPDGWVHEQDNRKVILGEAGERTALVQEIGLNRYTRLTDSEAETVAAPALEHWQRVAPFWADVRSAWAAVFERGETVTVRGKVDGQRLHEPIGELEETAVAENAPVGAFEDRIAGVLERYLAEPAETMTVASR